MSCYLAPRTDTCWCHLGRHGDMMILMPAFKHFYDTTGIKPVVMCCSEFLGTVDCCKYIRPWGIDGLSWFRDVEFARQIAKYWFSSVIVPKWWDCPSVRPPMPLPDEPITVLKHLGRKMVVSAKEWDSYQYSQWRATGLSRQQMLDLPLVFDNRNTAREGVLVSHYMNWKVPVVLYNFSGTSNPMPFAPEVMRALIPLRGRIQLVDMANIRAECVPDMLGMMDRALCSINGDTATLHLAAASPTPHIAIVANGGAGSIPKGNCILKLRYKEVPRRSAEIAKAIEGLLWAVAEGKKL